MSIYDTINSGLSITDHQMGSYYNVLLSSLYDETDATYLFIISVIKKILRDNNIHKKYIDIIFIYEDGNYYLNYSYIYDDSDIISSFKKVFCNTEDYMQIQDPLLEKYSFKELLSHPLYIFFTSEEAMHPSYIFTLEEYQKWYNGILSAKKRTLLENILSD